MYEADWGAMNSGLLHPQQDSMGPWPLLMMVSGYAAMERGSELIEAIDLIKALYIVDLEHLAMFWHDWEGFERLVSNQPLVDGQSKMYINRMYYLIYLHEVKTVTPADKINILGSPSPKFQEIVNAARALASKREAAPSTPTSRDLLFCVCSHDPELRAALQASGLQLGKLTVAVGGATS
ncbi:MAG TPA: hypothetical protein VGP89_02210 [Candidatus Angelobacter sp.]|jgi:hypothetical protein|nr:hypothetical protein [Candidatus Angelobacter sp.]